MQMKAIDRATARFAEVGFRRIEVPEWGEAGAPFIVFARPMTLADRKALGPYDERKAGDYAAELIRRKACDEDGNPLFSPADVPKLLAEADASVVMRLAAAIMEPPGVPETLKN